MRPAKNLEKLIKNIDIDTNTKVDKAVLDDVIEAFESSKNKKSATYQPNIWRIITKSRITKLAAAAVIIILVIGGLYHYTGFFHGTTAAFATSDVIIAMKQVQWTHATCKFIDHINVPVDKLKYWNGLEFWQSIDPYRNISIGSSGDIEFTELNSEKVYDPKTNTITITSTRYPEKDLPASMQEIWLAFVSDFEKDEGAKVEYSDSVYEDRPAKIIKVDYTKESGWHEEITVIVDAETRLARKIMVYQKTTNGISGTILILIDYPTTGPKDIYEAGAPRDAKVKIIDERPTPELLEVIEPYRAAREKLVPRYILIVTHWHTSEISRVHVIYNDGRKQRFESHFVFKPGDAIYEMWPVYSAAMGTTFDSLLQWAQHGKCGSVTIYLYDGEYYYKFEKDDADKWSADKKLYSPDFNPSPTGDLADLGWPRISDTAKVIENISAKDLGLLCIENHIESEIKQGKLIRAAEKWVYYLDPQHDYMCIRQERFGHRSHITEPSIDEIDFDPEDIPYEPYALTEVTEFGQTDTGQWCPRTIEHSSIGWDYKGNRLPLRLSFIKKIFLETSCQFPVDIFVPAKVIPKDGQAELSLRQSYDEIVKETIAIIDSREDWPEPKELVQKYWQARSAKDYDTMAILWPGSTTWNQKLLANEKSAEYVFGETEFPQYGGAYVPYAEKTYYEKNGKYSLKMWLHNDKSTKGRYYIISGN